MEKTEIGGTAVTKDWLRRTCWAAVAAALSVFSGLGAASAQQAKTPSDWGFQVTPYLWGAGIGGNITTAKGRSASFSQSFSDLLNNLNAGLMLTGEMRYQRWYLLADFDYMKLTTDAAGSVPILGQPSLEVKSYLGTLDGGYRIVDSDSFKLDGMVGVRVMSMDNTLNFSLVPRSPSVSATWADPLVAARAILPIGSSFFANAIGDVGGGPNGDLTWQLYGGLGYSFNQTVSAYAGYRYLSIKHDVNNLTFDMNMQGPLVGVGIRF